MSLAIIIVILFRKFPDIVTIDIHQIPKERQIQVKHRLIEDRIERKMILLRDKIRKFFSPLEKFLRDFFIKLKDKILILEEKYRQKSNLLIQKEPEKLQQRIRTLMAEGRELEQNDNLIEAERRYIEIINLDKKNLFAYKTLGKIYLEKKDYEHAKEIFKHILKIISRKRPLLPEEMDRAAETHLELGSIYKILGKNKKALSNFKKAVDLKPNDPKALDALIEMSIIIKDKRLATQVLKELKEVNPENEKIEEFEKRIADFKDKELKMS